MRGSGHRALTGSTYGLNISRKGDSRRIATSGRRRPGSAYLWLVFPRSMRHSRIGKVNLKVDPCPGCDSTQIRP